MAERVGLIGLGAMGRGMAHSLARAGFRVRGYDIRPDIRVDGIEAATSSAAACSGAEIAVIVVLNADQVEEAVFGSDGVLAGLQRDGLVICAATMSAARARAVGSRAHAAGLRWLEAPISGGTTRAEDGTLTSMVGGERSDLERARSVLEAYSRDIFLLGPLGAGSTAKLVNQVLVYCNLAAVAEAMTLCRKLGVDGHAVYDVIRTAMGTSAIFETRVPRILDGSYQSGGSLRIALKDLGIVEETAREIGMPMFMSAQAAQLFRATAAAGNLEADDLAIAQLLEKLSGLT